MLKERTVANVLRPIFAVLMVFIFMYSTTCFILRGTIVSKVFWRDVVLGDNVMDELHDAIQVELKKNGTDYKGLEDAADELAVYMLDECLNSIFEEDYQVDYDGFEEIYEEYFIPYLEKEGADRNQIKELKGDLYDQVGDEVAALRDEFGNDINHLVIRTQRELVYYGSVGLAVVVIFEVVLFLIHRNKFKPIRALGISMTISEGLCFLGYLILGLLFVAIMQANIEGDAENLLKAIVGNFSKGVFIICACTFALLLVGITLIIVGSVLTGKKNRKYADEHPELTKNMFIVNNASQPYSQTVTQYNPNGYQTMQQQYQQGYQPMQPQYQQGYQPLQQQYQQGYQPMQQQYQPVQPQYQQQQQVSLGQQPIDPQSATKPQYTTEGLPIYQSNNMPYNQGYSNQVFPETEPRPSSSNSSSDHYDWDEELE